MSIVQDFNPSTIRMILHIMELARRAIRVEIPDRIRNIVYFCAVKKGF